MSLLHVFPYLAVLAPEKQQWIAIPNHYILDFSDEDCMISGLLGRLQTALQIRYRAVEYGSSVARAVEPSASFGLGVLVRALWTRVVLRDSPLVLPEHVDPETFLRVQVVVGTRAVIDANQHQHRV